MTLDSPRRALSADEAQVAARDFNLFDPEMVEPYTAFAAFREHCPVARGEQFGGFWILSSYADVVEAHQDHQNLKAEQIAIPRMDPPDGPLVPINYDPPEHKLYRKDLNSLFSPKAIAQVQDVLTSRARELVEAIADAGGGDLMAEFCVPYPTEMFLTILGADMNDAGQMLAWKTIMVEDGFSGVPERVARGMQARREVTQYWTRQLEARERLADPPDDVLTHMTRASKGDRPFTRAEQTNALSLFMAAGLDTVSAVLSRTLLHLARTPHHRRLLRENRDLVPGAVEEFLRFYAPVTTARVCRGEHQVRDVTIPAGDQVQLVIPSANRDADEFDRPEEIVLDRSPNRHLAFGAGPHRCLGLHLARAELITALDAFLDVMPDFALRDPDKEPPHRWGVVFSLDQLDVVVEAERRQSGASADAARDEMSVALDAIVE